VDEVRHAVLSERLQESIRGRRVLAAIFTTYTFDPRFLEQEILPVLLDAPLSHLPDVRAAQLEDHLRSMERLAVFYDPRALDPTDGGRIRLDLERIPVRHRTGAFHPKVFLALVEERDPDPAGTRRRTLLVASLSANLTRTGWWHNVEAAHVVEVEPEGDDLVRKDLLDLLRPLRAAMAARGGGGNGSVEAIERFLGRPEPGQRSVDGRLHPRLHAGRQSLVDFLDEAAGKHLRGMNLEILSPYLDDDDRSLPLEELIERFRPAETRILLPIGRDGTAACRESLYRRVRSLEGVSWGALPPAIRRDGPRKDARERTIHAKLLRFFSRRPGREICLVGSPNLTRPGHAGSARGNVEAALLVEVDGSGRPGFWLSSLEAEPTSFAVPAASEKADALDLSRTEVRFDWSRREGEIRWDHRERSPALFLHEPGGSPIASVGSLAPGEWTPLATDPPLDRLLRGSALLEVRATGAETRMILVQEEGMRHKPSILLSLSVADILRSWALLTPEQRSAFLEHRAAAASADEGLDVALARLGGETAETLFDRMAACFHAFACLERGVRAAIAEGRHEEAASRLFGAKYDSVATLLDRADDPAGPVDPVDRYLLYLSARQLVEELRKEAIPGFARADRRAEWDALVARIARIEALRESLAAAGDGSLRAFLEWFEPHFLARAEPPREAVR
jgi:hypothetical protein